MKEDEYERKSRRALAIVEFFIFAGVSCIVPFLSMHMRSLGISTVQEVMIVQAVSGILVCLLIPLLMAFSLDLSFAALKRQFHFYRASRTEHLQEQGRRNTITTTSGGRSLPKWCLCSCLVVSAICCSTLLAVPKVVRMPRQPLLDFDCYFFSAFSKKYEIKTAALRVEKCANWASCGDAAKSFGTNAHFRISHCRQKCQKNNASSETLSVPSHVLHVCFGPTPSRATFVDADKKKERLFCLAHDPRLDTEEGSSHLEFRADLSYWKFSEFQNVSVTEFLKMDPRAPSYSIDVCAFGPTILSSVTTALHVREEPRGSISCGKMPYVVSQDCTIRCLLTVQPEVPAYRLSYKRINSCQEIVGNPGHTFWAYLGLRSIVDVSIVSIICLLEGFNFLNSPWWVKPYSLQYNRGRTWSILAFAIFPPIFGILVDKFGNYSPAFVVSAGFQMIAVVIAIAMPLPGCGPSATYVIHSPSSSMNDNEASLQRFWWSWPEACFTLSLALTLGILWSFAQVFSAWLYQDLVGFEHWTVGLSETLCFMCFFPLLIISPFLLRDVGETYLCAAAFAFHALRHIGFSLVSTYGESKYGWWWPLPLEVMKAVALPFGWIALCARGERALAHEHPGQKRLVILHSLLAVTHFGAGQAVGVCLGGVLSDEYGFPTTFICASVLALTMALLSVLSHFGHFRSQHRSRQAKLRTRQVTRALAVHGSNIELWEPEDQWPAINGPEFPFFQQPGSSDIDADGEESLENL